MELLKSLLSIGLLGVIFYAVGVILVEGGASSKQVIVPRNRKQRYRFESISFIEYLFGLLLLASTVYVYTYQNINTTSFYITSISVLFGLILKLVLLEADFSNLKLIVINKRLGTKISFIFILTWGFIAFLLISIAKSDIEVILNTLIAGYLFLVTIFAKSKIAHNFEIIIADITLKDGTELNNKEILDENNDFVILENGKFNNLLVSKDQISKYSVRIDLSPYSTSE